MSHPRAHLTVHLPVMFWVHQLFLVGKSFLERNGHCILHSHVSNNSFIFFAAFEQALQLATSESDKSQILAALAMVAYQMEDVDNAKTLLFQW